MIELAAGATLATLLFVTFITAELLFKLALLTRMMAGGLENPKVNLEGTTRPYAIVSVLAGVLLALLLL